jgi:energy-coupling factor transporter ATP-binding protein EcfA2
VTRREGERGGPQTQGHPAHTDDDQTNDREQDGIRTVRLAPVTDIVMRATEWVWDRRIPTGEITLIAGREGAGKSTAGCHTAASITRGRLPGRYKGEPRMVAVAAAEDSWAKTILPRLVAAGADLAYVRRVDVREVDGTAGTLTLPKDIDATGAALRADGAVMLLLDPIMSRLDGKLDSHKDAEVRRALEPVREMAERAGSGVLGVIHPNKGVSTDPLNTIMGSRAFTAVARSVLYVVRDPDDDRRRLLGVVKANLTDEDAVPTLAFVVSEQTVGADPDSGDPITAAAITLRGVDDRKVRDMLAELSDGTDVRTATAEAAVWLRDYLAQEGGVAWSKDAKDAGRKAGSWSDRTMLRAATRLRLVVSSEGYPKRTRWSFGATP